MRRPIATILRAHDIAKEVFAQAVRQEGLRITKLDPEAVKLSIKTMLAEDERFYIEAERQIAFVKSFRKEA